MPGGAYAFVSALWGRAAPAILAGALFLYAPYAFQADLFKRADLPEALGLALIPWLLLALWRLWTASTAGGACAGWRGPPSLAGRSCCCTT